MAEPSEVQALAKISTEVDESQINVILSSQCIKAQSFLLDKLRKQSERQKEICGFISSANLKLECEIKQAELEIRSLRNALETIKHANVELKKEYLLAKEKRSDILDRIKAGEKKYEQLWLESKSRYESIAFVKTLLQAQSEAQVLQDGISNYVNQANSLVKEKYIKSDDFKILDRRRIIEIAQFFIHDVPKQSQIIQDKTVKIIELTKQLENIENELKAEEKLLPVNAVLHENAKAASQQKNDIIDENNWAGLNDINENTLLMPTFDEANIDLDIISDKLKKVKKGDLLNYAPIEDATILSSNERDNKPSTKYDWNILKMEPYVSPYFTKIDYNNVESEKRTEKKLIKILDDINMGKYDTQDILSRVNPEKLQEVTMINSNAEAKKQNTTTPSTSELIEEMNVISSYRSSIVIPPTQFLDLSQEKILGSSQLQYENVSISKGSDNENLQELKSSQDAAKSVSFNLSTSMEICEETEKLEQNLVNDSCETINSTLDHGAVSDDEFQKIKDMVLKKHRLLGSSPEFVYAKKTFQTNNNTSTSVVTSNFFGDQSNIECGNVIAYDSDNKPASDGCLDNLIEENENNNNNKMEIEAQETEAQNNFEKLEVDNLLDSNHEINESQKASVTGVLFAHKSGALPESLNVSMSTTGYEDGEGNLPNFIDSNLLLSPKAETQLGDNIEGKSQEVPNFLSGLRKTGLTLFGDSPSDSKEDSNNKNQISGNNFTFAFGGNDKKSRGGFFNIFN